MAEQVVRLRIALFLRFRDCPVDVRWQCLGFARSFVDMNTRATLVGVDVVSPLIAVGNILDGHYSRS